MKLETIKIIYMETKTTFEKNKHFFYFIFYKYIYEMYSYRIKGC